MDEELLGEFLTESNESLDAIEQQLMDLEASPDDSELLDSIFRAIHTVKGSCGFLNLTRLEKVAHAGENLLSRIRELKYHVDEDIVSLLLECADAIKDVLAGLEETGQEPVLDHDELIVRLQACEKKVMGQDSEEQEELGNETELHEKQVTQVKPLAWLEGFEDDVIAAMLENHLTTASSLIEAGFASLRNIEALTPADALKILGMARARVESGDDIEVQSQEEPDNKPLKAPKLETKTSDEVEPTVSQGKADTTSSVPVVQSKLVEQAEKKTDASPVKQKRSASNESIRVDIELLDELMNQVGELVLTRNSLVQMIQDSGSMEFVRIGRDVDQITEQLQEQLLRTRMQPIQSIWSSVPRIVRDIGKQLDKKIKVVMEGEDTELDRTILNALKDPLTHIIRNSCDHGIESPKVRLAADKQATGTLKLSAVQESGFIVITIHDDGGGIDAQRIKDKALSMGVINAEQAESMADKTALQLIFNAGLSTAEKVTNFSGRGVGMDVVRTEIERVGGSVDIDSELGQGTSLRIRIPLTLAIISAMIVVCEDKRFAIPQMSVQELLSAPANSDDWRLIAGQAFYRLRGKLLPVLRLNEGLGFSKDKPLAGSIVVADIGDRTYGILVDEILGAEEIVVKPLGIHFQHLNFYGGCSILGDGAVIPIFDCNGLASMIQLESAPTEAIDYMNEHDDKLAEERQHALVFMQGEQRFVIPMTLIERLEYIEASRIEKTASGEVLQYRGDVIRVLRWGEMLGQAPAVSTGEDEYCLILADNGKRMCLQVDQVVDILEVGFEIKQTSDTPLLLGTTVIEGIATEVVDVFEVVQSADPNWFTDTPDQAKKSVLFVEDSQFFRQMVTPIIETLGFVVRTAADGAQACKLLDNYSPDFILTDIEMPIMNGYELGKWVKTQPHLSDVPVIALTAQQSMDDQLAKTLFDEVLSKKDSSQLAKDLEQALSTYGVLEIPKSGVQPAIAVS
ncbi:MAG: chemotaxis protein CheW [Ghiorsea sp.]|nr:chemotaxis protein CheW [Ghiorsea sp.]